ncbi:hypothetical protein HAX54_031866, partial [Datura stramonium]|nr:hypothetical protein [Datura stramonium]
MSSERASVRPVGGLYKLYQGLVVWSRELSKNLLRIHERLLGLVPSQYESHQGFM